MRYKFSNVEGNVVRGRETVKSNVQYVQQNVLSRYSYATRPTVGSKVGESRFRMRTHVAHVVTRHARHTARARAPRAPCNARRARGLAELSAYRYRGGQSDLDARDTRAHVERSGQAHVLLVHMSTRGPRLALRRRPLVLGSVRNAHGATQPAAPPPCRQHTLLAPIRLPTAAQLVRAQATLPPTGPDLHLEFTESALNSPPALSSA